MIALTDDIFSTLLSKARVRPHSVDAMQKAAKGNAVDFALALVQDGYLERDSAGEILAEKAGCTYINLGKVIILDDIARLLPANEARRLQAIPMYKLGNAITVSLAEPYDHSRIAALEKLLGVSVSPMFSFPDEIDSAIKVHYQTQVNIDDLISKLRLTPLLNREINDIQLAELIKTKLLVDISDAIVLLALKERASDIHIEPKKNDLTIRFRIDGSLKNRMYLPVEMTLPLISRYKIISGMDITERRKPQDGRLNFPLPDRALDMRISSLPTLHGEKLVMRVLGSIYSNTMLNLDKLDISHDNLRLLKNTLLRPNGMLLVTGPTGSGKSTTLYAALNYLSNPEVNILTIEDPVEYDVPALNQVMVNDKAGRSFQATLRAALRQDPDIILVGEIRDVETARIASQAALTGHLILSSLHTNDSIQASTRLYEMGVEPFLVASAMLGVVSQRLVKRICTHCRSAHDADPEYLRQYFYWSDDFKLPQLYRGEGCEKCDGKGYFGRIGIHELLTITPAIRKAILDGASYAEIQKIAIAEGFRDMRYDGFKKALRGLTTMEEVARATVGGSI